MLELKSKNEALKKEETLNGKPSGMTVIHFFYDKYECYSYLALLF
jgi:hypothetical protein